MWSLTKRVDERNGSQREREREREITQSEEPHHTHTQHKKMGSGLCGSTNKSPTPKVVEELKKKGATYLGVNVQFLRAFVKKERIGKGMSTGEVAGKIVKVITKEKRVALIDMIKDGEYQVENSEAGIGNAFAMVSHAWGSPFLATYVRV